MTDTIKGMIGQKFAVTAYIKPETFQKIEAQRGDVTRSTYISKLISNMMNV
jgi:hypothetical protein